MSGEQKTDKVGQALANTKEPKSLQDIIKASAKELGKALPNHMRPERLVRVALTCIRQNPQLAKCSPMSFMGALFMAAQLGLEPGVAGQAWILPFKNSKTGQLDAQFVCGYKGLASLFYRHERGMLLQAGVVKAADEFEYEYGLNPVLKHRPAIGERGQSIGYYIIATLSGGAKTFLYMTAAECMDHGKKHSKTYDKEKGDFYSSSPWHNDPDSMCLKTVFIQLSKYVPISVEIQKAVAADETSREFRAGINDAFDLKDTTDWGSGAISTEAEVVVEQGPIKQEVVNGSITAKQVEAIENLAKKVYGVPSWKKVNDRIGADYGVGSIIELSTEAAAKLITVLSKEIPEGKGK